MDNETAYRYKALNGESYRTLAAFAATLEATVTLYPALRTIVISGEGVAEAGKFVDDKGLDFHIDPIEDDDAVDNETTDAATLRRILYRVLADRKKDEIRRDSIIADITAQRDEAEKGRDFYCRRWNEANTRQCRIREQVQAIGVMINSIFPKQTSSPKSDQ